MLSNLIGPRTYILRATTCLRESPGRSLGLNYSFEKNKSKMSALNNILYPDLNSVLDVLKPEAAENAIVKSLLGVYNNALDASRKFSSMENKKFPLIVLEGLDGSGKSTMSKQLSKRIHAKKWQTPSESVKHLRDYFDKNPSLRTAFYQLGNYIAALEISCRLYDSPVVMDRYWHSTAAYAIAQAVADNPQLYTMPKKGDPIYTWPKDLLKPDIVLFLSVSEQNRLQRQSKRQAITNQEVLLINSDLFRQNVVKAYKNMVDPSVDIVESNQSFMKTVYTLLDKVKPLL